MSYEWSESQQAFVLREPAVPVSALRALLDEMDKTAPQFPQRLTPWMRKLAALCDAAEPK
jgi:hypothetical protein